MPAAADRRMETTPMTVPGPSLPTGERILITGGAGFIGSTFAARVIEQNQVVAFDTFDRDALSQHPGLAEHPNFAIVRGSILEPGQLQDAAKGCTMVVHCAAIAGVDTVMNHPAQVMRVNLIGTWNVLEAAAELPDLRRFVDFSTSEVYGAHAWEVSEASDAVVGAVGEPRWTYAVSKLAAEHSTWTFHREFGLPTVTLRPFNVYGPRQIGEGAVHRFVRQALSGQEITVHDDGNQLRSWCYVDDFVDALLRCCTLDAAVGHSFNIGNPRATVTTLHLAHEVLRAAEVDVPIRMQPWGKANVHLRVPDIAQSRALLGFEPQVDLAEGLRRTIAWYRTLNDVGAVP
jgi:UDP-glucose 4-epimerase